MCISCYGKISHWVDKQDVPEPELPRGVNSFYAPFLYKSVLRNIILKFKFKDRPELAAYLASFINYQNHWHDVDIIIPVPVHEKRLRHRMFNQSAFLAKELGKTLRIQTDVMSLKRVRNTPQQVGKTLSQRKRSVSGAFVASDKVKDKTVLLVDDIWTSGSTAASCARALKKAGTKNVHVVTLAYVDPKGIDGKEYNENGEKEWLT